MITPLIEISDRIYGKLETINRTGSVKDRMIDYIMDRAVANEIVLPEETRVVEATSGNTGISLASYCAYLGCKCKIIMPENMSQQRRDMMTAFGAEIELTGHNEFMCAIEIRDKYISEGWFSPKQFSNPLNVECHEKETGPEIQCQVRENCIKWSVFVHGAGTGGTMMGVKNFIDKRGLDVKCILTVPEEDAALHGIQGINDGADFLLDKSKMDGIIEIKTEEAISRMKKFWKETGMLIGISSGANILASERYLEKNDITGNIITFLCDRGERYL